MNENKKNEQDTSVCLQAYIDGMQLKRDISVLGYPLMQYIKFVSIDENNVLRVVLAGSCPNCECNHLRNTCNYMYVRDVMSPIIKMKYTRVKDVKPLYSFDNDIDMVISRLGGKITNPCADKKELFYYVQRFMFDDHPNVNGSVKFMDTKIDNDSVYDMNQHVNRQDVCAKYTMYWLVERTTSFIDVSNGQLIQGVTNILKNESKLPPYLKLVRVTNVRSKEIQYCLKTGNSEFFNEREYKMITFS